MIKIEKIYACNDEELSKKLNDIEGRIISMEYKSDNYYKVIYDDNCVQLTNENN